MAVTYYAEEGLITTCESIKTSIKTFEEYVSDMNKITSGLLDTWEGRGSIEFQYQYNLIKGQLDDITDGLYDIYDALVDARTAYIDADEASAKQMSAAMA